MQQLSILGCGWLGLPLAKALLEGGFTVKGSTTSIEKLAVLREAKIQPYTVSVHEDHIEGNIAGLLEGSDILIIDIPPKLRKAESENFIAKIQLLIPFMEEAGINKVLFVSSTSVYADDNSTVTEDSPAYPDTESGRQLLETETLLQNNPCFKTTVMRFGGLIGDNRHPVKYLAGRENLPDPDAPVNLIHRDDCIGIIRQIIQKNAWGETFNAVTPQHPTREEYYTIKAKKMGLEAPKFNKGGGSKGKKIASSKVSSILDYTFIKDIYGELF